MNCRCSFIYEFKKIIVLLLQSKYYWEKICILETEFNAVIWKTIKAALNIMFSLFSVTQSSKFFLTTAVYCQLIKVSRLYLTKIGLDFLN